MKNCAANGHDPNDSSELLPDQRAVLRKGNVTIIPRLSRSLEKAIEARRGRYAVPVTAYSARFRTERRPSRAPPGLSFESDVRCSC
jgi:hypothetical protein